MFINVNDLKFEFKFRDQADMDKFPATMTLIIGQFKIKGFSIRKTIYEENKNNFVLFPPSNPAGGGKYIKLFWTKPKENWKELEEKALEQFKKEHEEFLLNSSANQLNDLSNIKF